MDCSEGLILPFPWSPVPAYCHPPLSQLSRLLWLFLGFLRQKYSFALWGISTSNSVSLATHLIPPSASDVHSQHVIQVWCIPPTLELLSCSPSICQDVHGGHWMFLSCHGSPTSSVLSVVSKPGWVTTFTALCSNLKRTCMFPVSLSRGLVPFLFGKSCLPLFSFRVQRWLLPSANCCLLDQSLICLPSPFQEPILAGSMWLCPCQSAYGSSEVMPTRQKAVIWGSHRLSMAVSGEEFYFLRVDICFHSCEREWLAK